jgi:hypothetical protein
MNIQSIQSDHFKEVYFVFLNLMSSVYHHYKILVHFFYCDLLVLLGVNGQKSWDQLKKHLFLKSYSVWLLSFGLILRNCSFFLAYIVQAI